MIPLNKHDKAIINTVILILWCHDKYWSRIGVNIAPISPPIPSNRKAAVKAVYATSNYFAFNGIIDPMNVLQYPLNIKVIA